MKANTTIPGGRYLTATGWVDANGKPVAPPEGMEDVTHPAQRVTSSPSPVEESVVESVEADSVATEEETSTEEAEGGDSGESSEEGDGEEVEEGESEEDSDESDESESQEETAKPKRRRRKRK